MQSYPPTGLNPPEAPHAAIPAPDAPAGEVAEHHDHPISLIRVSNRPLTIICVLLGLFTLRFSRPVLVPLVAAVVLALLLSPLVAWLKRHYVPRHLGSALVLFLVVGLLAGGGYELYQPALRWIDRFPELLHKLDRHLETVTEPVTRVQEATRQAGLGGATSPGEGLASRVWDDALRIAAQIGVCFTLTYLLLSSGDLYLRKLVHLLPRTGDKKKVVAVANGITKNISQYLATLVVLNIALGFIVAVSLWAIGMPSAGLWGTVAGLLNFVPYLGPLTTATILALVATSAFTSTAVIASIVVAFWILTSLEGSVVRPIILGKRLSLNPVPVFVSIIFWGWMWGAPGVLLATPILVSLRMISEHVPSMKAMRTFLEP